MNPLELLAQMYKRPLTRAAHTTFERPKYYGNVDEEGNPVSEIRAINLSKKNALDHAFLVDQAGLARFPSMGHFLADRYEASQEYDRNTQDFKNNEVAELFFSDLYKREPMLNTYQRMMKAAQSIRDREYMRNPQFPWAYYKNRMPGIQ